MTTARPAQTLLRTITLGLILLGMPLLARTVMYAPDGIDAPKGETSDPGGWWGPSTSNVNWCEADYVVSFGIAEFWNTLSSFAMVCHGVYGLVMHWRAKVETRFFASFFMLSVVGVGSTLFHGTLWRSMQLMDELPMLWATAVFIYVCLTIEEPRDQPNWFALVFLVLLTLLETLLVTLFDNETQNLFLLSYLGGVLFIVLASSKHNRRYNPKSVGLLMELAVLFYVAGGFAWLVDRNFCVYVRGLHLHAAWHLLASSGTFTCIVCWLYLRHVRLGDKVKVHRPAPLTWIEITPQA